MNIRLTWTPNPQYQQYKLNIECPAFGYINTIIQSIDALTYEFNAPSGNSVSVSLSGFPAPDGAEGDVLIARTSFTVPEPVVAPPPPPPPDPSAQTFEVAL